MGTFGGISLEKKRTRRDARLDQSRRSGTLPGRSAEVMFVLFVLYIVLFPLHIPMLNSHSNEVGGNQWMIYYYLHALLF